jgi:hypothetical protein
MAGLSISELSRRRVFRGAAIYVIVAWAALRVLDAGSEPFDAVRRLALMWAIGLFPLAILFSWAFRVLPGVVRREHYGEGPPPTTALGRTIDITAVVGLAVVVIDTVIRLL